jgi:hypothetical protein
MKHPNINWGIVALIGIPGSIFLLWGIVMVHFVVKYW